MGADAPLSTFSLITSIHRAGPSGIVFLIRALLIAKCVGYFITINSTRSGALALAEGTLLTDT